MRRLCGWMGRFSRAQKTPEQDEGVEQDQKTKKPTYPVSVRSAHRAKSANRVAAGGNVRAVVGDAHAISMALNKRTMLLVRSGFFPVDAGVEDDAM